MGINFLGMNLRLWKLHSVSDYACFFFFMAAGALAFVFLAKRIGTKRHDAAAAKRVGKKLRRLCKKDGAVLDAGRFAVPGGKADLLLVSSRGIFALRCIGWGIRVFGSAGSPEWRVEDNNETRRIPNPLTEASSAAAALTAQLEEQGLAATARPFADPFDSPRLSLEGGVSAVAYGDLKKWYHSQPEQSAMDRSARDGIIQALALAESKEERKS